MRPESIKNYERFFFAAFALELINSAVSYEDNLGPILSDPAMAEAGLGAGFLISMMIIGFAIALLLWYLTARRASNIAKWIQIVLFGFGVLITVTSWGDMVGPGMVAPFLVLAITVLNFVSLSFLFRADAKAWLESKGRFGDVDPTIFD